MRISFRTLTEAPLLMMEICQKFSKVSSVAMSSKFSTGLTFENLNNVLTVCSPSASEFSSLLQGSAAVCCGVLRCVAVCCSVFCYVAVWFSSVPCAPHQRTNTRRYLKGLRPYVAVCCGVLRCVAVRCSVL